MCRSQWPTEEAYDDLKLSVEKFIENNYFDKDVFDFDDDE